MSAWTRGSPIEVMTKARQLREERSRERPLSTNPIVEIAATTATNNQAAG